jgi:Glycosyl hydrolase family 26
VARLGLLVASALVAVAAVFVAPGRPAATQVVTTTCGKVLPPSWGAYLGAFEDNVTDRRIATFEQLAGHTVSWVSFSQPWYRGLRFPRDRVLTIWRHGAVPYIAFLPTSSPRQRRPERRFTLQRIVDGVFDRQLRAWADGAGKLGVPLLLSFGAEVNDDWAPWNARWNGAGRTDGYGDPADPDGAERFRDAYRHLVTLFRGEGANNVSFVFHVDAYRPDHDWNALDLYYPGDGYVDWLGISVLGAPAPSSRKRDVAGVYHTLTELSRRPIAIAALGSVERAAAENGEGIRNATRASRSGRYARIRAAVWSDMHGEALREDLRGSFFSARARFTGDCGPPPPASVFATPGRPGVIRVRWSPVTIASAYEVWRDGRRVAITKETTWVDATAGAGRRHRYTVRAVNPGGRSV